MADGRPNVTYGETRFVANRPCLRRIRTKQTARPAGEPRLLAAPAEREASEGRSLEGMPPQNRSAGRSPTRGLLIEFRDAARYVVESVGGEADEGQDLIGNRCDRAGRW